MVVHYIRVSTLDQNTARQERLDIDKLFIDKCSGASSLKDRKEGKKLLKLIEGGHVRELHIHSLDRLGRNLIDVLNVINYLNDKKVCLISSKEGIRTLNNDLTINPMARLLIGVLGTFAEFELNRSKERQAEGIAAAKLRGVYKGRPVGSIEGDAVILNKKKNKDIIKLLARGESVRNTALLLKTSTSQVSKIKAMINKL